MSTTKIAEALEEIREGKMIILVDDEDRENEGDLCMAAEKVTPETVNCMSRYVLAPSVHRMAVLGLSLSWLM